MHAGWRGVLNNIIVKTVRQAQARPEDIIAYIGPAICMEHFEVGQEVFNLFKNENSAYIHFFKRKNTTKYVCDLNKIAAYQLEQSGLQPQHIFSSKTCTYCNSELFYSYRREAVTGRFASLIWLDQE